MLALLALQAPSPNSTPVSKLRRVATVKQKKLVKQNGKWVEVYVDRGPGHALPRKPFHQNNAGGGHRTAPIYDGRGGEGK